MASTRAERFDTLVLDALEPIELRWRDQLNALDVAVDEVPEGKPGRSRSSSDDAAADGVLRDGAVPLAKLVPAGVDSAGSPTRARIVLYRRPLELRAKDAADLTELVHEVLVEQVANYLGLDPDVIEGN
ncbi:putative Zn-dependent protease with MMP-like domain [Tamaricihabitans halophyticus]|uniref:Putative Zn-dependent protease with MMP-like domain n=1 Tax=Tamaricihabitans halophyticus TaxID=1262583 RepID=A0A4V2ST31_9PSEU|nr:putative Zn-dependent protease with MMP-like domain [Tamaricihabitans halophyticus]